MVGDAPFLLALRRYSMLCSRIASVMNKDLAWQRPKVASVRSGAFSTR